jgi:hypothetical protein
LEHGDLISSMAMESYGDVFRSLSVPFYRSLPHELGAKAAATYGLLRQLRSELSAHQTWPPAKLDAIYHDDVRSTLTAFLEHAARFGVRLEGIPGTIAKHDIALYHMQTPSQVG